MTNNLVNTLYEESQDNPDSLLWQAAQKLEQAEARVAELEAKEDQLFETFVKVADYLGIDAEAARKIPGKPSKVFIAAVIRKQAEAVEETAMQFPESPFVDCDNVRADILKDAQRLRQEADEAENG